MNINDFDMMGREVIRGLHEVIVKRKDNDGIRFGLMVQSVAPVNAAWVVHQFTSNFKGFFIDVDSSVEFISGSV